MRAKSVHKILQKPVLKTGVHSTIRDPIHNKRNCIFLSEGCGIHKVASTSRCMVFLP